MRQQRSGLSGGSADGQEAVFQFSVLVAARAQLHYVCVQEGVRCPSGLLGHAPTAHESCSASVAAEALSIIQLQHMPAAAV
jgi:hypothetical protein